MQAIFFSHSNGFPAETYNCFFEAMQPYPVDFVPVLGEHTPEPLRNWRSLTRELIAAIESRHSAPVIGIGHSLGAVLTLWAAVERPGLFSRIILMDPPLFAPYKRGLLRGIYLLGLAPWLNPVARKARNRRQHFPSREAAEAYWRPKALFRNFQEACFLDYVKHGLRESETGFTLRFPAQREYQLFLHTPLHIGPPPQVPAHCLCSSSGQVLQPIDIKWLKSHLHTMTFVEAKGGHMFPLEWPEATAAQVRRIIEARK